MIKDIGVGGGLIILLVVLANPFNFWMPNALAMTILAVITVLFAIFSAFVWKEKAADERENAHAMFAGRVAFLVGSAVLLAGVISQSFSHQLDIWLVLALGAMVTAKLIARAVIHRDM